MSTRRRRRASSRSSRAAPATRNPRAMIASVRAGDRDIATHVVADLRAMALELGVDVPARVKKASLVELIRNNVFGDDDDEDDEDDDDDDDDDDNQDENNANANVDSDNGEGVGVPIGGNLPSVGESDEEQQHNNPATQQHQRPLPPLIQRPPTLKPSRWRRTDDILPTLRSKLLVE